MFSYYSSLIFCLFGLVECSIGLSKVNVKKYR